MNSPISGSITRGLDKTSPRGRSVETPSVTTQMRLGAVLWIGSEAIGLVVQRLRARTGNLAAAGVAGYLMLFRAIAVGVVLIAVAASDKWLGLAAALTYAAGYSAAFGLSLVAYYTGPEAGKTA